MPHDTSRWHVPEPSVPEAGSIASIPFRRKERDALLRDESLRTQPSSNRSTDLRRKNKGTTNRIIKGKVEEQKSGEKLSSSAAQSLEPRNLLPRETKGKPNFCFYFTSTLYHMKSNCVKHFVTDFTDYSTLSGPLLIWSLKNLRIRSSLTASILSR